MGLIREELWKLRLKDARKSIIAALPEKTYTRQAIETVLVEERDEWRFPRTLHSEYFLDYLVRSKIMQRHLFTKEGDAGSATYSKEMTLFAKPEATDFDIALGLRGKSFFSHLSAAYIHGLTNLVPKVFYTNREQAPKGPAGTSEADLKQDAVDGAFAKPARKTGLVYTDERIRVVLLAGMFTDQLDVVEANLTEAEEAYLTTSLERTLIDCTVRPAHAGGIHEVLGMYEAARERLSVRRMHKLLEQFAFVYPYRQAVGFMLERAGYPKKQQALFETPSFNIDFYLEYAMPETEFSSRWRLHYPRGF